MSVILANVEIRSAQNQWNSGSPLSRRGRVRMFIEAGGNRVHRGQYHYLSTVTLRSIACSSPDSPVRLK